MPLYDCKCLKCGTKEDIWARIDEIHPVCPDCGRTMERLISPTRIICDVEPYFDHNLADVKKAPQGSYVASRQDRKRKMRELGLVEAG
jgi:putative FmdB family regulatory protein